MSERKHNNNKSQRSSRPRAPLTAVSRLSPVAPRLLTILRYSEAIDISSGGPVGADYIFMINSLFDPNFTGTGHQPMGFDQLSTLYNRYRVYSVKATVSLNAGSTNTRGVVLVCTPTNNTTSFGTTGTGTQTARESMLSHQAVTGSSTGAIPAKVQMNISLPLINGRTRQQYADDDTTQALTSASPAENLTLHVCASSQDGTALSATINVFLEFTCEFFDVLQLTAS